MTEQERQPCGSYHPLPCGLDAACTVPVEFFDATSDSETIYHDYVNRYD